MNALERTHLALVAAQLSRWLSRTAIREVVCAAAGLKPVRLTVLESDADEILCLLNSARLASVQSACAVWLRCDSGKGGWSSGIGAEHEGPPFVHLYVANSSTAACRLRAAEESESADAFGRELLIPSCCRAMFCRCAEAASGEQNDFFRFSFPDPRCEVPWELNLAAQYFDASLISHYPCSAACVDSLRLARLAWRIYGAVQPEAALGCRAALSSIGLYSESMGVHLFSGRAQADGWVAVLSGDRHSTASGPLDSIVDQCSEMRSLGDAIEYRNASQIRRLQCDGARLLIPTQQ